MSIIAVPSPPALRDVTIDTATIRLLLYGPPGSGKTTFAGTSIFHPAMKDVLILAIDKGEKSVATLGNFKSVPIGNSDDLEAVVYALAQRRPGYENFRTLIVDGISELQTIENENIVTQEIKKGNKSDRFGVDDVQLQDYGLSGRRIGRLMRYLRDSGCHLIITAWDKAVYPKMNVDMRKKTKEETQPIKIAPMLTDALKTALMGHMDFVWPIKVGDNGERWVLTQPAGVYEAKTRGLKFARELGKTFQMKDPLDESSKGHTLASIFDLINKVEQTPQEEKKVEISND